MQGHSPGWEQSMGHSTGSRATTAGGLLGLGRVWVSEDPGAEILS